MKKSKADNVGPGSYEPKVPLQTTFPAFSFGYKEDPKNMDNKVPGPGTYPKEIDESSLSEKDRLLISRTKLRSEKDKFRFFIHFLNESHPIKQENWVRIFLQRFP